MPIVTIPKRVMTMYDPVDPGYYTFRVGKCETKQSKDKLSTNFEFEFEIVGGKDGKFNDQIIPQTFNSKPMGLKGLGEFVGAAMETNLKEMEQESAEVDLDKLAGKMVDAELTNEVYEGRIQNRIKNFAPAGKLTNTPVPFG